ncbi:MAG: GMC oxidoreductase [Beijerinckiaceae bacterium]|nr:GMC oxidoreductase [Beijerinckiaceae bacterium]
MFIDSTTLPEDAAIEADICIAGAGAAGIALARDLAGGTRRIAVLESGGFELNLETQQLYQGDVIGQPYDPLDMDRLRYFGGTTNHWGGYCRPFDAMDFEGWPFERAALDSYYPRAQEICQLGPYTYELQDWVTGDAPPLDFGPGARLVSGVYQLSPPTRFGTIYRHDLEVANNVSVYLNANLVNIETNDSASEVTGFALACLNGRKLRARARHYVLATGGIENPRLLLNSSKVQKAGLGNGYDLVGRYFMDHAQPYNVASVILADSHPNLEFYTAHTVRGQLVRGYLAPSAELRQKEGLPAFAIQISAGHSPEFDAAKASLRTIYGAIKSGHLPDRLMSHVSKILVGVESRVIREYKQWMSTSREGLFAATYIVGSPPDPESRVTLTSAVDALGLRRVQLDWRLPGDFERTMRRSLEILAEEFGRKGLGRLRMNSAETGYSNTGIGAWHQMGTTRMHSNPRQGVVDEHCRVHGIANLFIGGSSVFPTYSFDNPTMTIVALSLKLSDHLKSLSS